MNRDPLARYSRQVFFEHVGVEGQQQLLNARVLLVGCGALGTVLANTLVRAGVGHLRICDRDFIEPDNLQRQMLFDEADIEAHIPKAEAAARKLRRINSEIEIEARVTDVNFTNIESLAEGACLLLDGTDNFETRYLINDLAVKTSRPWIYGAVIGSSGLCMTILPRDTPCLRCVFDEPPPPDGNPTCDTAGVLGPTVGVVAALQSIEAMKVLMGKRDQVNRTLISIDVWTGRMTHLHLQSSDAAVPCTCCGAGDYEYLSGRRGSTSAALCGRNAVQIDPRGSVAQGGVDFAALADKLKSVSEGPIVHNRFLLRAIIGEHEWTLFPDGRAIIKGTAEPEKARSLYARYFGA